MGEKRYSCVHSEHRRLRDVSTPRPGHSFVNIRGTYCTGGWVGLQDRSEQTWRGENVSFPPQF